MFRGCGEFEAHVLTKLARFKVPRDIIFVDDLPRHGFGQGATFHAATARRAGARARRGVLKIAVLGGG